MGIDVSWLSQAGKRTKDNRGIAEASREFVLPKAILTKVEGELVEGEFLIATDGFWTELSPSEQVRFMDRQHIPMAAEGDDRSLLQFRFTDSTQDGDIRIQPDNFYVRRRRAAALVNAKGSPRASAAKFTVRKVLISTKSTPHRMVFVGINPLVISASVYNLVAMLTAIIVEHGANQAAFRHGIFARFICNC